MASRRRLEQRFPFASHAVHHRRLHSCPALEVLEGRVVLSTFTVNSLGDSGTGSNDSGDLRYCINQANANDQANTIVFDSTVFGTPQTITLGGSQLELSDTGGTQTITGPAAGVTVNAGGKSRVFDVEGGVTASISGMTISNGSVTPYLNSGGFGGGLANYGTVTLNNCTFSGNSAVDPNGPEFATGEGGGMWNSGSAYLTDCTFSGNSAGVFGGGGLMVWRGTANLTGCTLSGNTANFGGGLTTTGGTANLTDCTLSGNSGGSGGGICNEGTANLTGCTLSGNTANSGAGMMNYLGGKANLTDCTLSDNSGGGLTNQSDANANLTGCTLAQLRRWHREQRHGQPGRLHLERQLRWGRRRHVEQRHGLPHRLHLERQLRRERRRHRQ